MGLRHFLVTIPLGSLVLTVLILYVMPMTDLRPQWYELYLIIAAVNLAVTLLAYLLIPDGPGVRRPSAR
ncbi:MAG: hypothetical protein ABC585_05730 [Candidatus Methanosuratincola petrocarbonis]